MSIVLGIEAQRVAEWMAVRSRGALRGGHDPIGLLMANYDFRNGELLHERAEHKRLRDTLVRIEGYERALAAATDPDTARGVTTAIFQLVHAALWPSREPEQVQTLQQMAEAAATHVRPQLREVV